MTQLRAKNSKVLAVVHLSSVYILLSHKTITFIHLADSYPKQRTNFIFLPVHIRKLHKFGKVRENSSTSVSHYIEKKITVDVKVVAMDSTHWYSWIL